MIIEEAPKQQKTRRKNTEARIQTECVVWFWNYYPQYRRLLFHVENENSRPDGNAIQGAMRKAMGVVAGVSDLILLVPSGKFHGLCIEMKDKDGQQRKEQREWQVLVEAQGYRYEICRSKAQFEEIIEDYFLE